MTKAAGGIESPLFTYLFSIILFYYFISFSFIYGAYVHTYSILW
jgi:hypothetical protein